VKSSLPPNLNPGTIQRRKKRKARCSLLEERCNDGCICYDTLSYLTKSSCQMTDAMLRALLRHSPFTEKLQQGKKVHRSAYSVWSILHLTSTSIILITHCHANCHILIPKFGHVFILELHPQSFITSSKSELFGGWQRLNSLQRVCLLQCATGHC
jgi:hypothetical protein